MLSIELMGGLGNQLFQLFMLIAYSKKFNENFLLEKKTFLPGQYVVRDVYWDSMFDKLSHRLIDSTLNYHLIREKSFEYEELTEINKNIINIKKINNVNNFKFFGYYQTFKYFQEFQDDIIKELDFYSKREIVIKKAINVDVKNMISLHFRIGDYLKLQEYHPIMTIEYYENSIKTIVEREKEEKQTILYFCEENDIEYVNTTFLNNLKKTFPTIEFVKADGSLKDWEQMLLMSACKHHIIANSSFSWWGAYLAEVEKKNDKIVCYPDKWFGSKIGKKNIMDLFPNKWIKCESGSKYILENVYYINLENRIDRRILVENELKKMNWKFERFNAIRLKDGRAGCSLSHLKLIEMAKQKQLEYIVVVEDDIQFTKPEFFNNLIQKFMSMNMDYDVLLLAGNLRYPTIQETEFVYKISKAWTTTGYIVKKKYYDTLLNNYKEGIQKLLKSPYLKGFHEIDAYWQHLQEKDKWYIFRPRTITQRPDFSTIENRITNYNHLLLDQ